MNHDDCDPLLDVLFGDNDPPPREFPSLSPDELRGAPELPKAEVDRLVDRLNFESFAETVFGVPAEPILSDHGDPRVGPNGKPMFGKTTSLDELSQMVMKTAQMVAEAAQRGEPEALAILQSGRNREALQASTEDFRQRMAEKADEFAPMIAPFIKAWAANDHGAMRQAVAQML